MHRLSPSYANTCVASICCHLAVFCDLLINLMVSRSPTLTSCMFHSCFSSTFRWYLPNKNGNLKLISVLPIAAIFKPVCLWSTNKIVKSVEPPPVCGSIGPAHNVTHLGLREESSFNCRPERKASDGFSEAGAPLWTLLWK